MGGAVRGGRTRTLAVFLLLLLSLLTPGTAAAAERPAPPSDPYWGDQWSLTTNPGVGIDLLEAWRYGRGKGVVIAVVDTGIIPQPEFKGRILPGYDFIRNLLVANDGDGRDPDPRDPGDWVTKSEAEGGEIDDECKEEASSWHGTHVAGIALAAAGNGVGIVGVAPQAKLLPVRAIGKCGGTDRDLVDAIRWAGGLRVEGVPENRNPADIINLSLGGQQGCSAALQSAIDELSALEIIVVAAVGNEAIPAADFSPANCSGTLTVAATDRDGQRAPYSNYGSYVDVAAPGGASNATGVISTVDSGRQGPKGPALKSLAGTSMAAPHVAGMLAIARGLDPTISRVELLTLFLDNLAAFAPDTVEYGCSIQGLCGAGFADTGALITALQTRPTPVLTITPLSAALLNEGMDFSVSVDVGELSLSLETPELCEFDGQSIYGISRGSCTIIASIPSTSLTKGLRQRISIPVVGYSAVLVVEAPATAKIRSKVDLVISSVSDATPTLKSKTPLICRVGLTGALRAIAAGTCRVVVKVAQTETHEPARQKVLIKITR